MATPATLVTTLIRGDRLVDSLWKNGGGLTREIAAAPLVASGAASLDAFAWRVSLADVAQSGPFSRFIGVDRTLVLLEGAGMLLDEYADAESAARAEARRTYVLLKPYDTVRFAGETLAGARLVKGPTRDLNLMLRRGVASGDIEVWRGAGTRDCRATVALLFCANGAARVVADGAAPATLAAGDTLRLDAPSRSIALDIDCDADTVLLAIRIALLEAATNETASP